MAKDAFAHTYFNERYEWSTQQMRDFHAAYRDVIEDDFQLCIQIYYMLAPEQPLLQHIITNAHRRIPAEELLKDCNYKKKIFDWCEGTMNERIWSRLMTTKFADNRGTIKGSNEIPIFLFFDGVRFARKGGDLRICGQTKELKDGGGRLVGQGQIIDTVTPNKYVLDVAGGGYTDSPLTAKCYMAPLNEEWMQQGTFRVHWTNILRYQYPKASMTDVMETVELMVAEMSKRPDYITTYKVKLENVTEVHGTTKKLSRRVKGKLYRIEEKKIRSKRYVYEKVTKPNKYKYGDLIYNIWGAFCAKQYWDHEQFNEMLVSKNGRMVVLDFKNKSVTGCYREMEGRIQVIKGITVQGGRDLAPQIDIID